MSPFPKRVDTTIIDGVDLRVAPVNISVTPVNHRSAYTGTLGTSLLGWKRLKGAAYFSAQYDRLSRTQASRLLMMFADPPMGKARLIRFSASGKTYSTRRFRASLAPSSVKGTFTIAVEFAGNAVAI